MRGASIVRLAARGLRRAAGSRLAVGSRLAAHGSRLAARAMGAVLAAAAGAVLIAAPPMDDTSPASTAQEAPAIDPLHAPLDALLDVYVRDGFVYYRALAQDRATLDRYLASLDVAADAYERWERDRKAAFWLNAYNAIVLRTVVDRYPIRGTAQAYPLNSIRQIPGAFERTTWKVARRAVTLDEIETKEIAAFRDPRMFFGLGRGSVGGGRLRSEAFASQRLETQLSDVAAECVRRAECARVDESADAVNVSPVFSWRESDFVAAYAGAARDRFPGRSPIELAIVAFLEPHLYPNERAWLARNTFRVAYDTYDWRLNDLTGGAPR